MCILSAMKTIPLDDKQIEAYKAILRDEEAVVETFTLAFKCAAKNLREVGRRKEEWEKSIQDLSSDAMKSFRVPDSSYVVEFVNKQMVLLEPGETYKENK